MRDFDKLRHNMKSGIEGVFIPISLTKAVKIYDSKRMAQKTRKRQIKAWRKGLAPKVFAGAVTKCKFTWKRKKGCEWKVGQKFGWFYVTEIAPLQPNCTFEEKRELEKALHKLRLGNDLHDNNMRRLRNGKLVAIDFGEYSTD